MTPPHGTFNYLAVEVRSEVEAAEPENLEVAAAEVSTEVVEAEGAPKLCADAAVSTLR